MPLAVEGQDIALAILADEPGAWDRFCDQYHRLLLQIAYGRWYFDYRLHDRTTPDDLVQGFYSEKCVPKDRQLLMFGPTSLGVKPLKPVLGTSLTHFCQDKARAYGRMSDLPPVGGGVLPDPPEPDIAAGEIQTKQKQMHVDVRQRVADQLDAIRKALPAPGKGVLPHKHLLLLLERVYLLEQVGTSYVLSDGTLPAGIVPCVIVERLSPWTRDETSQPIGGKSLGLGSVWCDVHARSVAPNFHVSERDVAIILDVTPNNCTVKKRRARDIVRNHHGDDHCRELFPHW